MSLPVSVPASPLSLCLPFFPVFVSLLVLFSRLYPLALKCLACPVAEVSPRGFEQKVPTASSLSLSHVDPRPINGFTVVLIKSFCITFDT